MPIVGGEASGNAIIEVANYSALPAANTVTGELYAVLASQGTYWLPGSLGGTYYPKGLYYSDGSSWIFTETPYNATQATVNAGTNDDQFVTPKTLKNSAQFQYLDVTSSIQTQLNNKGYAITIGTTTGNNPAANTTYNWGLNGVAFTGGTAPTRAIAITKAGVITDISLYCYVAATIGSAENNTMSLLIYNLADGLVAISTTTLTSAFQFNSASRLNEYIGSGLNISVSAGDILQIKLVTNATLGTPPTGCIFSGSIFVKTT